MFLSLGFFPAHKLLKLSIAFIAFSHPCSLMQGRTYFMAAHTESEMEAWLRTLVRAGLHVHHGPSAARASRFYAVRADSGLFLDALLVSHVAVPYCRMTRRMRKAMTSVHYLFPPLLAL